MSTCLEGGRRTNSAKDPVGPLFMTSAGPCALLRITELSADTLGQGVDFQIDEAIDQLPGGGPLGRTLVKHQTQQSSHAWSHLRSQNAWIWKNGVDMRRGQGGRAGFHEGASSG